VGPFVAPGVDGNHVYLGFCVRRGVIFVDLALAQIAALGVTVAFLAGHEIQSEASYWYALVFTLGGAALFAVSRTRRTPVPQEAIIGIVYVVSAAAAVLVIDRAPQGGEHIRQILVGSILTVTPVEVGTLALLYAPIGVLHWLIRRPLLDISFDPTAPARAGRARMDFVFYASFGVVVTSSVRLAGVLLVFAYLVVPATAAALLARSARAVCSPDGRSESWSAWAASPHRGRGACRPARPWSWRSACSWQASGSRTRLRGSRATRERGIGRCEASGSSCARSSGSPGSCWCRAADGPLVARLAGGLGSRSRDLAELRRARHAS
jgi:zinc/manganese transport system permease protein